MKHLYLFLILLFTSAFGFSQVQLGCILPAPTPADYDYQTQQFTYHFKVKNVGNSTLTNVHMDALYTTPYNQQLTYSGTIPSLAPGDEDVTSLTATEYYDPNNAGTGFEQCVLLRTGKVLATMPDGSETSAISHYDSYYSGGAETYMTMIANMVNLHVFPSYTDLNQNSVVDAGDRITYGFSLSNEFSFGIFPFTDMWITLNPVAGEPYFSGPSQSDVGYLDYNTSLSQNHTITQSEVDAGYIFYNVDFTTFSLCNSTYVSYNCPNCPQPSNCPNCVVTDLTGLNPNYIKGKVDFNLNTNDCATGSPMANRRVKAATTDYSFDSFTDEQGNYTIYAPSGAFSVHTDLGAAFTSNPSNYSIACPGHDVVYPNTDFCIASANNMSDLSVQFIPLDVARPGFSTRYYLHYYNRGSTALNGTIAFDYNAAKLDFTSASPAFYTNSPGNLSWTFTNLLPFQEGHIVVTLHVAEPPTANSGDMLTFLLTGTISGTDVFPADNSSAYVQQVFNSFDPNDKTVLPGALLSQEQAGGYLTYVTRFQNTGTFAAESVVLQEELDSKLDWNTFEPYGASHPYSIQLADNRLKVIFKNINLPDSTANEPGSHGWFAYRIKLKPGFTYGDIASSQSAIYFDFNAPIYTNTATTQLEALTTTNVEGEKWSVYPNPAGATLSVKGLNSKATFRIIDMDGRFLTAELPLQSGQIDVSGLESGFYFLSLRSENKSTKIKFIKK